MTSNAMPTRTARGRTSRRTKVGTGIALLIGLFVGLIGLAPSAFAHHAYVQADVKGVCDAPGTIRVSFTVKSWGTWDSGQRVMNSSIGIQYRTSDTTPISEDVTKMSLDVTTGAFTNNNNGGTPSFTGSFVLPASEAGKYVQVRAYPKGNWYSRHADDTQGPNAANDDSFTVSTQKLPAGCEPKADPSATATVDCANDEIDLAFTGKGAATTVKISKGDTVLEQTFPIPVTGAAYSIPLTSADENATLVIHLDYAVGTDQTLNVKVDCDKPASPSASVSWECGQNAVVTLQNSGGEPVTATVTRNGSTVHTVQLAAGADTTRQVLITADDEDKDVVIMVTFSDAGTGTDVTYTAEVDCKKPKPVVGAPECAPSGILIPLSNTGDQTVTFTVTSPVLNPTTQDIVVSGGGSSSIILPVAEDATTSVSIKVGVTEIYGNQALKRDCEKPAATVTFDCAVGGVVVELTNDGPNLAKVPVNGTIVEVPGKTTADKPVTVTIPVAEGEKYDITVLGKQAKGTRDCEKPGATVEFTCAVGGVTVVLTNAGEIPTTILVNTESYEVDPGKSQTITIPVVEGADYDVTVTGDGLRKTEAGTRNCETPVVTSAKLVCAEGGVVVVLTNTGERDTVVKVGDQTVTVPKNGTKTVTVPVTEGAEYSVKITGDGIDQTVAGTRDCEKPGATVAFSCAVGGVTVVLTNAGEIPTTILVNTDSYTVEPGKPQTITIPVVEGADYNVTVTGDGLRKTEAGTRDCEKPTVDSAELVCAEGGVVVVLTNTGERDTAVKVGDQTVTVPKNGTKTVTIPVTEGAEYSVKITGDGIDQSVSGVRDCENPAVVSAEVVCAEGGVVVELVNPDPDGAQTIVKVNGEDVVVPAGTTAENPVTKLVLVDENASYSISVIGDELEQTFTGTRNCEQPEVDATQVVCAEGGVAVTLSNSGKADTTVTVAGTPVVVPAGSTARVVVPVAENAAYDFLVEGDELSQQVTGTRDCQLPELVVDEVVCAEGGLNAVLRNTGTDTGTFVVTSPALPGGVLQETMAAGASTSVLIPLAEGASTTVRVTSGDKVLYDSTVTRDCEQVEGVQVTPQAPQVQAAQAMPRTGSDLNGLLAGGVALLLAGLALVAGSARRRTEDI